MNISGDLFSRKTYFQGSFTKNVWERSQPVLLRNGQIFLRERSHKNVLERATFPKMNVNKFAENLFCLLNKI